jgi:hypothetical protein
MIVGLLAVAGSAAAENGWIAGTVKEGNTPLAGVTVTVSGEAGTATTDANGTYNISVPEGTYNLTATKTGYVDNSASQVAVTANNTTAQDFTMAKQTGYLTGTVKGDDGSPVYNATVTAVGGSYVMTNSSGMYNLTGLALGSTNFTVTSSGYPQYNFTMTIAAGANTKDVTLVMAKQTGYLTGTVKGDDGSPVYPATVTAVGGSYVMTNSTGKYNLTGLALGSTNFTVTSSGYPQYNFTMTIAAGANTKDVTLVMETYVEVYVTGPTLFGVPRPLEGATVTVGTATATTNSLGYAKMTVPAGNYKMTLKAKDYKTTTKDINVTRGANTYNAQLAKTSGTSEETGLLAGLFAAGILCIILVVILPIVIIVLIIVWLVRRKKGNQPVAAPMPPPPAPPQTPPPPPPQA